MFANQNKYDQTLQYITVYNGGKIREASIDLGAFLDKGTKFEISDAQNYFGEPVMRGVYNGKPIRLPLAGKKVSTPIGETEQNPVHTSPELSVFVVRKTLLGSNR